MRIIKESNFSTSKLLKASDAIEKVLNTLSAEVDPDTEEEYINIVGAVLGSAVHKQFYYKRTSNEGQKQFINVLKNNL